MITASTRYDYIDIAKGLGILAVVWAHIIVVGWSHRLIYAFHMPLFFFLSGILFDRKKYASFKEFLIKRGKRLLLPYFIYSFVTWFIWAVFRYFRHDPVASYISPLLQTFIAKGSGEFLVHNSALWFIPCLFIVEILYYFISKLPEYANLFVCFLFCATSFLFGRIWKEEWWFLLPFNFDAVMVAMPFYSVGDFLAKHFSHQKLIKTVSSKKRITLFVWLCFSFVLFWMSMEFGEGSMGSSSYHCPGWVYVLRAFIGIFAMLSFSLLVSSVENKYLLFGRIDRFVRWQGRYSMDVMCLHIPVKGVGVLLVAKVLRTTAENVSSDFMMSFVTFIITMCFVSYIVFSINYYLRKEK